jgi:hypothetical protein
MQSRDGEVITNLDMGSLGIDLTCVRMEPRCWLPQRV